MFDELDVLTDALEVPTIIWTQNDSIPESRGVEGVDDLLQSGIAYSQLFPDKRRVTRRNANGTLPVPQPVQPLRDLTTNREIEDLRSPMVKRGVSPLRTTSGVARVVMPSVNNDRMGFNDAVNTMICVRRNQRREVIFARGFWGSGGRSPRFSWRTSIHCRGIR